MYSYLGCKKKVVKKANPKESDKQYLIDRRKIERVNLTWGLKECRKLSLPIIFLDETTFILKDLK